MTVAKKLALKSRFGEWLAGNRVARGVAESALVRYSAARRLKLDRLDIRKAQSETLRKLMHHARSTRFGSDHGFGGIRNYEEYARRVPVRSYEDFWNDYWKTVYPSTAGATWPDEIPYWALSSGTTSGTTKYLPVSRQMIASNRKAAFTSLAWFRAEYPKHQLMNGKFFFLGGSTEMSKQADGSRAGDLSAIAAIEGNMWIRPYTFPPLELSALSNWEVKARRLAEAAAKEPITAISGVPAWMLVIFDHLKQVTGKSTVGEIWPQLKLVIHGGTRFDPYRDLFQREIGNADVKYLDVYPCSEGYIAAEDPRYQLLRIIPDHGLFFEFIPVELSQDGMKIDPTKRFALWQVETGVEYAVVITSCAGLWSYQVGDTVCFEKVDPPLIRFTGRTKFFLSAFGEHLIGEEVTRALTSAACATGGEVIDFHVGPVFPSAPNQPGFHRYLVEFERVPTDLAGFAKHLDDCLSEQNEDYRAHRVGDLSLLRPEVVVVPRGAFLKWRLSQGGRAEQGKVPIMDNTGKLTEKLVAWMAANRV